MPSRQRKTDRPLPSLENNLSVHVTTKLEVESTDRSSKLTQTAGVTSLSKVRQLLGFDSTSLSSREKFIRLCNAPRDASCLAAFRVAFGTLMVFDSILERGFSSAIGRWNDEDATCRFPLVNFLEPLPLPWMVVLYLAMTTGAAGIALGLFYRLSCLMFVLPYWYIFLLEKTSWNNHSYLFGLVGILLLLTDANRYWSIDCWRKPDLYNADIPAWQYGLFRFQLILVYFIAGLKKLDKDWIQGYSMSSLSHQWVFDPFRHFLTADQIAKYIIHWGGLTMDLTAGFLLYLDQTRWVGTAMVTSFHFMNAQMFAIGQFPYVMLCTTLLFYPYDTPKKFFPFRRNAVPESTNRSSHCLYDKQKPMLYHKFFAMFTVGFMMWQSFLPYSHGVTKGYNNWVGGLYGYSWDMMIHNWNTQHIKIKYVNKLTGENGYIDPEAFVNAGRWASHPDMIKQHAECIAKHLEDSYDLSNLEIYMDIWQSMNQRFQQRMVDPTVDILTVPWSPFRPASFLLPLLNDLEGWRAQLQAIAKEAQEKDRMNWLLESPDTTFVADFPGMALENYIHDDLRMTNITLLAGSALLLSVESGKNTSLGVNDPVRVGVGTHKVLVTSDIPACYMYTYSNTTNAKLRSQLSQLEHQIVEQKVDNAALEKQAAQNETLRRLLVMKREKDQQVKKDQANNQTLWRQHYDSISNTLAVIRNSFVLGSTAIESLITGEPMTDIIESRYGAEETRFQ